MKTCPGCGFELPNKSFYHNRAANTVADLCRACDTSRHPRYWVRATHGQIEIDEELILDLNEAPYPVKYGSCIRPSTIPGRIIRCPMYTACGAVAGKGGMVACERVAIREMEGQVIIVY